ncbi:hypothetical protein [Aquimarina sp. MAR_2010_214]|nr:hypothetical protein [Aquimarina sp. MAR_2010_214]
MLQNKVISIYCVIDNPLEEMNFEKYHIHTFLDNEELIAVQM